MAQVYRIALVSFTRCTCPYFKSPWFKKVSSLIITQQPCRIKKDYSRLASYNVMSWVSLFSYASQVKRVGTWTVSLKQRSWWNKITCVLVQTKICYIFLSILLTYTGLLTNESTNMYATVCHNIPSQHSSHTKICWLWLFISCLPSFQQIQDQE
jgi:hypothetical protein